MSFLDPINQYCERGGPGLLAEPLNAASNIAFFIAAWALWRLYRKAAPDTPVAILILLLALVGIGSTLFHTFANRLAMLGDVIPIGLFTFYYLWVALRRLAELSPRAAAAALIAFAAAAALLSHLAQGWPPAWQFNGSTAYFPCLAALAIIGGILHFRRHPGAGFLLRATGWFAISLAYRSLDLQLCPAFPLGTHFLWHSINGWVLYLLVRGVMKI